MSDSFLPRIQSVFYAVFDVNQGPKIVFQVPEDLIATTVVDSPDPLSPTSPTDFYRPSRLHPLPRRHSDALFYFDDISKYVIPPSQLCGRLVTCATKNHRIIGFPVELRGKYMRNYFRYNLCFVFDRPADLSCYEPIVRKVSRVLSSCEKESGFLSNPDTALAIHPILEQLYEDLNSYSETSIPVDPFNSIELKIFPFYPNPPAVHDWMVPLALINITKRVEGNWDLSMVKICKFIDGTNHISRIAHLADCDIAVTRQAISHLLFYQVIMTIDIFQYSNMYTLRKSIQWLADEAHVQEECGPYVTRPGNPIPDWPKLLHLYSRLKPGKTVLEWMEEHNVHQLGIDIRRFTSFGVIKGFLRRVHRWPVLLPPDPSQPQPQPQPQPEIYPLPHSLPQPQLPLIPTSAFPRKRGESLSNMPLRFSPYNASPPPPDAGSLLRPTPAAHSSPDTAPSLPTTPQDATPATTALTLAPAPPPPISATRRARRASAAEKVLEQLRSRDLHKSGGAGAGAGAGVGSASGASSSPRTSWIHYQQKDDALLLPAHAYTHMHMHEAAAPGRASGSRRHSLIAPVGPPPSPVLKPTALAAMGPATRPRPVWSPSAPQMNMGGAGYPPELLELLDGEHHTDELAVRFEAGWPVLEGWLVAAGGGAGDGDFGRVCIIYR